MSPLSLQTPIGLLGLGIIGSRIAQHLSHKGWNITPWNRTPKDDFPTAAQSPLEVAQKCQILCLYLKDDKACLDILAQMQAALTPEHIILNHSTISLETVHACAALCQEKGALYWDAPFTGSKLAAEGGQLAYYISGPLEQLSPLRPLLEASSKGIVEVGTEIGQATIVKLVTNLLSAVNVQALAEAQALVKSHGMSTDSLLEALQFNVCNSGVAQFKLPYMDKGDFAPHFSLSNMYKDSCYVQKLALKDGLATPAISLVSELMGQLCAQNHDQEDFCALALNYPTTPRK